MMKSTAVALGHPIHPMLIPFPFAFLTGAVLFDAAGWFRALPSWWTTGGYLSLAGIATAVLAAIPGLIDYLYTVPPDGTVKLAHDLRTAAQFVASAATPDRNLLGADQTVFRQPDNASG